MRIVLVMAPPDKADDLARILVAEQLAACVNVVPDVTSHYIWEGRQEADAESLMMAKVPVGKLGAFTDRVKALHPYEVPEVVALEVTGGNPAYLDWVKRGGG